MPLKIFTLYASMAGETALVRDLTPIRGMKLSMFRSPGLNLLTKESFGVIFDLAREGCDVQVPRIEAGDVHLADAKQFRDLNLLKGISVERLDISGSGVSDLGPLKEVAPGLRSLRLPLTKVVDLTPLSGMRLHELECHQTGVRDLSPLRGMPLTSLHIHGTEVTDLTPLDGMPLECVAFTPGKIAAGLDILRKMQTLKTIAVAHHMKYKPSEFWKRFDAGEFR